jgi:hypothetical protein
MVSALGNSSKTSFWPQEVGACMIGVGGGWWLRFRLSGSQNLLYVYTILNLHKTLFMVVYAASLVYQYYHLIHYFSVLTIT